MKKLLLLLLIFALSCSEKDEADEADDTLYCWKCTTLVKYNPPFIEQEFFVGWTEEMAKIYEQRDTAIYYTKCEKE